MTIELTIPDAVLPMVRLALQARLGTYGTVDPSVTDADLVEQDVRLYVERLLKSGKLAETAVARHEEQRQANVRASDDAEAFVITSGFAVTVK